MLRRPPSWKWVAAATAGAAALGLITYVSIVRLDVADRVASVVSGVVSVVFLIAEFGARGTTWGRARARQGGAAPVTGGVTGSAGWRSPHRIVAAALVA